MVQHACVYVYNERDAVEREREGVGRVIGAGSESAGIIASSLMEEKLNDGLVNLQ